MPGSMLPDTSTPRPKVRGTAKERARTAISRQFLKLHALTLPLNFGDVHQHSNCPDEGSVKPWLTHAEAAFAFGRSKRTIRLWIHDGRSNSNPVLRIREERIGSQVALNAEDLRRVCAFKDTHREAPTFGRA
jgi:hypothetical protein